MPDRLYYITHWDDEHCDLTVEQIVEKMLEGEDYDFIKDAGEVTTKDLENMKREIAILEQKKQRFGFGSGKKKSIMDRIKTAFGFGG